MRVRILAVLLVLSVTGLLIAGCTGNAYSNPQSPPTITAQPANQTVTQGQTASFSVSATGSGPLAYQWQKSGSAISGATAAAYTTPATTSADNGAQFTVIVSNAKGSATSNAATLTVTAASSVQITTTSLPNGQTQAAYSGTLQATGGTAPYTWSVSSGSLPAGLTLAASSGAISGTPTTAGTSSFTIQVADSAGNKASAGFSITITGGTGGGAAPFGHIVIVLEENHGYTDVVGTNAMPYLNTLISQYGLATQYYATTHPSIGNYMDLSTGQILTNDDGQTPTSFPVSQDNVIRELIAAGKTWKGYAEDLPSVGYTGPDTPTFPNYAVRHFPPPYMTDVQNSAAQKQNLVPFTQFTTDLAAGNLPNYSWITPNLCNDAHDCPLGTADTWLQTNIDPLIKNSSFQKDGLLIITFDEGNDNANGGGQVVCVLISPASSKKGFQSTTLYQHPSVLRLSLEGLGVKTLPGAAASAPPMWEFFTFPAP